MKPKFSIITVCLNEGGNIIKTCESVTDQSFADFEWIIVDGGSTDNTLEILSKYRHKISNLISEPDKGIYDAMNKGIALANGNYLLFLNAGDYLANTNVLEMVSNASSNDIIFGDLLLSNIRGESMVKSYPNTLGKYFLLKNMMPHQASFFRRELFDRYGFYDTCFKIAGDYDLFVRFLYINKASYYHIPETLAVFNTEGISSERSRRGLRTMENHQVRKKYFPWYVYGFKGLKMELRRLFCKR